ncbi:MAG: hypothetical protein M1358_12730 [Chloroflexi bacterium]|nr:hypothetical protein [Chloroflexota bacterium]
MHYWHTLLVKAATPDDAKLEAGKFLDEHQEGVWDFYNVGGSWTGIEGDDVLRVRGNEEKVKGAISTQLAAQKNSLRQCKTKLADNAVEIANLATPQESYETTGDPCRTIWAGCVLELAGKLAGNQYCVESWFWDVENDSSFLTEARWLEVVGQGDSYWLVGVDLHRQATP